jgi:hypothetical protein
VKCERFPRFRYHFPVARLAKAPPRDARWIRSASCAPIGCGQSRAVARSCLRLPAQLLAESSMFGFPGGMGRSPIEARRLRCACAFSRTKLLIHHDAHSRPAERGLR